MAETSKIEWTDAELRAMAGKRRPRAKPEGGAE